jgi:hypothetical protein
MESNEPLIPRRYQRMALAAAIILVLLAGGIWVGNYALTVFQQREKEAETAAQQAAWQAQLQKNERDADQRAKFLNETVPVSLTNESSSPVTLWSATPNGTNADGSPVFTYNALCTAPVGGTCTSMVYDHRGVQVHGATLWSSYNANWPWQAVVEGGGTLVAHDVAR